MSNNLPISNETSGLTINPFIYKGKKLPVPIAKWITDLVKFTGGSQGKTLSKSSPLYSDIRTTAERVRKDLKALSNPASPLYSDAGTLNSDNWDLISSSEDKILIRNKDTKGKDLSNMELELRTDSEKIEYVTVGLRKDNRKKEEILEFKIKKEDDELLNPGDSFLKVKFNNRNAISNIYAKTGGRISQWGVNSGLEDFESKVNLGY
ncbi:MAG: hypothetical protein HRT47_10035 [Candidatus Caenarcaniphilales bacterium]|nr:hypothetical protein [Candidatus Caenarcaniphilales bacterium]